MEKLMKFENSNIKIIEVNGEWLFEVYSVGMALGYVVYGKNKNNPFPNKARINKTLENAEINGCLHGVNTYLTESQVYNFMIEAHTQKCKVFRKWLTNEVLPALNHEGTYTMKHEPKPTKPYEYFDKTYNGVPVLTSADMEYLTKINHSTIDWNLRTKFISGKDFYYIFGNELKKYKKENPKASKMSSALYLVTREGFIKICRAYGVQIETPKCFEVKEEPRISAVRRIYDTFCKYYDIKRYQLTEDTAKILKCGENGIVNESCILRKTDNDEYKIFTDPTMPLLERQFTLTENLGRIMAGQLRENANPDINYDQEARLFGIVVMAMSLFFDK